MTTLPRDSEDHPILPGSRWRQRGVSGHAQQTVTVLRVGTRSVLLVIEGNLPVGSKKSSHRAGKRYNLQTEVFRANHILVSQPRNLKWPENPVEKEFAVRETVHALDTTLRGRDLRRVTYGQFEDVFPEQATLTETTEEEPATMITPEEADNAPIELTTPQAVALGAVPITAPSEGEGVGENDDSVDPIETFLTAGRDLVERLTRRLTKVEQDREEARRLLEEVEAQVQAIKGRRDRIQAGVKGAMLAMQHADSLDQTVNQENAALPVLSLATMSATDRAMEQMAAAMDTLVPQHSTPRKAPVSLGVPTVPPQGTVPYGWKRVEGTGKRGWIVNQLREQGRIEVTPLAIKYQGVYGGSREDAIKAVSSTLSDRVNRNQDVKRVGKGAYQIVG